MIDRIVVFVGSTKDFNVYLDSQILEEEETVTLVEVIQHYNARIRPSDSGVKEHQLGQKLQADNCVVRLDDYGSVLDHVLANFVNIVTRNYDIGTLFVQNPPKRVLRSLTSAYPEIIEYQCSKYENITRPVLKKIYRNLCSDVLGQEACKKQIISGLYKLTTKQTERPIVLMLYGPSGVGKTETAKSVSNTLGGHLLRVQFSMMQTTEAFDYVFGSEHSKGSFARDMLARESNVILIDEFDKVNARYYNAFYELFDEGRFVDTNYEVELKQTIFILTCNFMSETEIKSTLGPAMYSRIGSCIKYSDISKDQKKTIIRKWYKEIVGRLKSDEKAIIEKTDILNWFISNAGRYDNIRILKTKLENAIFDELADVFVIGGKMQS